RHFGVRVGEHLALALGHLDVADGDGDARPRGVLEAEPLDRVEHVRRDVVAVGADQAPGSCRVSLIASLKMIRPTLVLTNCPGAWPLPLPLPLPFAPTASWSGTRTRIDACRWIWPRSCA